MELVMKAQQVKQNLETFIIVCKKYWKNGESEEKAVTTSEALREYTIRSCHTIASNNCWL